MQLPTFTFCPKCGGHLSPEEDHFVCLACNYKLYLHSAATASIFIINDGKVLLATRKYEPKKGMLDSVGGFIKYGEDPKDAALRETKEEANLEIEILEELPVNMDQYEYQGETIPTLNFSFIAEIKSGKIKVMDDVESLTWFPINKIPYKKIGFDTIKKDLKNLEAWYKKTVT